MGLAYPELLAAMFQCMGEGLYAIDWDGRVLLINPQACEILGYQNDELVGKTMHDTTHYKHLDGSPFPKADCAGFAVISKGETVVVDEDYFVRKDGSFVPVAYTSSPIFREGKVVGAVVAFQDITARIEHEKALRNAEERLRLVYQTSKIGSWQLDADSEVLSVTPQFTEIVGLPNLSEITLAQFLNTMFVDSDRTRFQTNLEQALKKAGELQLELRIRRENKVRLVLVSGKAFYNKGQVTMLGLLFDITASKSERTFARNNRRGQHKAKRTI